MGSIGGMGWIFLGGGGVAPAPLGVVFWCHFVCGGRWKDLHLRSPVFAELANSVVHRPGTRRGTRTHNLRILSAPPLPVGLGG